MPETRINCLGMRGTEEGTLPMHSKAHLPIHTNLVSSPQTLDTLLLVVLHLAFGYSF